MKIIYISENIYHHMIPFAESLIEELGVENFRFGVLKPIEEFRVKMGFNKDDASKPWVINVYENDFNKIEYEYWLENADVVLFSNRNLFGIIEERLKKNKLTFYFSERWWKPNVGKWRLLHPSYLKLARNLRKFSKMTSFHYLAQGGYAAKDVSFFTQFGNRIWEFGYFTDVKPNDLVRINSDKISILWCGRMLRWKKVDSLIKAYSKVIKEHPNCILTIVGDGEEKEKLKTLAHSLLPENSYVFLESQPITRIRELMYESDIYVLPSSGYEGWGAVVNEAMAEKCAVIASVDSGAGKTIIKNGVNGFSFKSSDWKLLSTIISQLIVDESLRSRIQINGQQCVNQLWSPDVAASRLISVSDALLKKTDAPIFYEGPFSKPKL